MFLLSLFLVFVAMPLPEEQQSPQLVQQLQAQVLALTALLAQHGLSLPSGANGGGSRAKMAEAGGCGKGGNEKGNGTQQRQPAAAPVQNKASAAKVEDGGSWKTVAAQKRPAPPSGKDVLQPQGWSHPVLASLADAGMNADGVCLVSAKEAKEAVAEMGSTKPLAVLSPVPVGDRGQELPVLVKDATGNLQTRVRFLIQLGIGNVSFQPGNKREFKGGAVQMVVTIAKAQVVADAWNSTVSSPQQAAKRWLETVACAGCVDVQRPTRLVGQENVLQMVVLVAPTDKDKVLRACGKLGVQTRLFYERDEDRMLYSLVPLDKDASFASAQRMAQRLGDDAYGIVSTRSGWAIRVPTLRYPGIMRDVAPEQAARLLGSMFKVSGLPVTCGEESLKDLLSEWNFTPLFSFRQGWRRTWVVRSESQPPTLSFEHTFGWAVVAKWEERRRTTTVQKLVAPPRSGKSVVASPGRSSWPNAWGTATSSNGTGPTAAAVGRPRGVKRNVNEELDVESQTQLQSQYAPPPQAQQATFAPAPVPTADVAALVAQAVALAMAPMQTQLLTLHNELTAMKTGPGADEYAVFHPDGGAPGGPRMGDSFEDTQVDTQEEGQVSQPGGKG